MLHTHGASIDEETREAIHLVKDYTHHCGGINNMNISKEMIISSKHAQSRYENYLQEQRRLAEESAKEGKKIGNDRKNAELKDNKKKQKNRNNWRRTLLH